MENQTIKNIQHNLANSPVRPLYADEIVVVHTLKTGKDDKGKVMKEGHVHLVFIDMTTQRPIEKIVISPITAKGLANALNETMKKLDVDLKNKKVEKPKKVADSDYGYIR
jgi:hypothetical protein